MSIKITKEWVENAFLAVLRRRGSYSRDFKWYAVLKKKALLVLTENDFCEAENKAVDKFCVERKETRKNWELDHSRRLSTFLAGLV